MRAAFHDGLRTAADNDAIPCHRRADTSIRTGKDNARIRIGSCSRRPQVNTAKVVDEREYGCGRRIDERTYFDAAVPREQQADDDKQGDDRADGIQKFLHAVLWHNAPMNASHTRQLPIGVFDSGVGGLTVLRALREALPHEDLIYLGDTARLPYGTKSKSSISRYAGQATALLQERGIKLLVVACNTASAVALEALTQQMQPVPVIGVVEPGATAAVAARPGGRHLVLATEATVRYGAYRQAIARRDEQAEVRELACELMVSLAEEGWTDGSIAEAIIRRYLEPLAELAFEPDSVILGCTHFPLLRPAIRQVVPEGTAIVDSASTTASVAADMLAEAELLNEQERAGQLWLMATDGAGRFARVGGRFIGEDLDASDIEIVDL